MFFFSSRRRHTRWTGDWSSDVCSSDLPAPYNADQRPGDNKWATSVLARRPGDGTLVWAYQFTPADNWDYDAVQEMILADVTVTGRRRKVLVHFDKNGFAYTIDRATGEVLVAEPYA